MSARDICDYFQQKMPAMLARHKDPMASVTTVLNRLVEYGEAQAVVSNGRRAWRWVAEATGSTRLDERSSVGELSTSLRLGAAAPQRPLLLVVATLAAAAFLFPGAG